MFFFFNDTATTEIYTLSLHDALPISKCRKARSRKATVTRSARCSTFPSQFPRTNSSRSASRWKSKTFHISRSEEHTSELQSRPHLVCRLLLEKKKTNLLCRLHTHVSP